VSNDRLMCKIFKNLPTFVQLFQPSGRPTYIINIDRHWTSGSNILGLFVDLYSEIKIEKIPNFPKKHSRLAKTEKYQNIIMACSDPE